MTLGQMSFVENFNSLKQKVNINELSTMIQFCSLFRSDDVNYYEQFKQKCFNSINGINVEEFIKLYAQMYNLDPQKDIKTIMYLIVQYVINDGLSYHLGSSANAPSIMQYGLGISSIGLKTEERRDYERLTSLLDNDTLGRLLPFHKDYTVPKTFYSNKPIITSRYGDRPEWLKELKMNSTMLSDDNRSKSLVNSILEKYDKKYNGASKSLFIIPNPGKKLTEDYIESLLTRIPPKQIIQYLFNNVLNQNNLSTTNHISSSEIICVDISNGKLYGIVDGETKELQNEEVIRR